MGLVPFGQWRIGFWVVARGISAAEELPPGLVPVVFGQPSDDMRCLVVAAADGEGQVRWAAHLHANGAAVLLEFAGGLLAAMGRQMVLLDDAGSARHQRLMDDEVLAAWRVDDALLLAGPGRLWLVGPQLDVRWSRPVAGDRLHLLGTESLMAGGITALRVVSMTGDDWTERLLDLRTGATLGER